MSGSSWCWARGSPDGHPARLPLQRGFSHKFWLAVSEYAQKRASRRCSARERVRVRACARAHVRIAKTRGRRSGPAPRRGVGASLVERAAEHVAAPLVYCAWADDAEHAPELLRSTRPARADLWRDVGRDEMESPSFDCEEYFIGKLPPPPVVVIEDGAGNASTSRASEAEGPLPFQA
mmetsp:Transcript_2047/g.7495  ORF Transcript_2047/g.7495 Transcript_2047/m.7495 type:complete len:178 (-) Transcript_2047:718-1251(-)